MSIAYSTNAFTRTDLETAVRQISEIGFSGVEILCDKPHWFSTSVSAHQVSTIVQLLQSLNLNVSNLNANTATGYFGSLTSENAFEPSLSNPNIDYRRWRQKYSMDTIKLAKEIGANCISVTSGMPLPNVSRDYALELFIESLNVICDYAEKYQIKVGIEYEPGLLVERATDVAEVMDRVGSDYLGVNFDIGHSYLNDENPEETVAILAGRIWNVHVEDIKDKTHYHLIPGLGELPFTRYFTSLINSGYEGFYTVELYTYDHTPVDAGKNSLTYLTELLQALP